MTPELSEFSYGFALTHEIANFAGAGLKVAPIFPSLIEEGKAGGGYDVHLDWNGVPIFLQFKRADCLVKANAKQIKDGLHLNQPYYRFPITEKSRSAQHDLLLALDVDPNEVFYVAPRFHLVSELNDAYTNQTIFDDSLLIRPRDIGALDHERHCVAFDETHHYVCSDPRTVPGLDGGRLRTALNERLSVDERPLRSMIKDTLIVLERSLREAKIFPRELDFGRPEKSDEEHQLRRISDLALRYFNTQFFVVQRAGVGIAQ